MECLMNTTFMHYILSSEGVTQYLLMALLVVTNTVTGVLPKCYRLLPGVTCSRGVTQGVTVIIRLY